MLLHVFIDVACKMKEFDNLSFRIVVNITERRNNEFHLGYHIYSAYFTLHPNYRPIEPIVDYKAT